jgi:hypothetical protein
MTGAELLRLHGLEAQVRRLREDVDSLTRLVLDEPEIDEAEQELSLEAQHAAFATRVKEKRR